MNSCIDILYIKNFTLELNHSSYSTSLSGPIFELDEQRLLRQLD